MLRVGGFSLRRSDYQQNERGGGRPAMRAETMPLPSLTAWAVCPSNLKRGYKVTRVGRSLSPAKTKTPTTGFSAGYSYTR